ncbi:hypothetical protein [Pseudomonas tohonis]|uniref:hypothetical protein n=1 Tax=Pseudomonas tohonis TaxID=2725477 RepID=UPI0022F0AF3C|nr:hypothetical protein [Pseudomonas tohonis]
MTPIKLAAIVLLIPLAGCSVKNLKAPDYVDLTQPVPDPTNAVRPYEHSALWPIINLKRHYIPYRNGANTNKATLDSVALGGAGVAAIGAATQSKSEVYKASAAIIATAFGLEEWGNFKQQSKLYEGAINYLECAESSSRVILNMEDIDFQTTLSAIAARKSSLSKAYDNANIERVLTASKQAIPPAVKTGSLFTSASGTSFQPTDRDVALMNAISAAESDDILNARKIVLEHPLRISDDVIKLQTETSQAVAASSFDTQKAVGKIVPKKAEGSSGVLEGASQFVGSSDETLTKAHLIIDAYNKYEMCSTKITQLAQD